MPAHFSSFVSRNTPFYDHSTTILRPFYDHSTRSVKRTSEPFLSIFIKKQSQPHHVYLPTATTTTTTTTTCPPHSSSIRPPLSDADELKVGWMDERKREITLRRRMDGERGPSKRSTFTYPMHCHRLKADEREG